MAPQKITRVLMDCHHDGTVACSTRGMIIKNSQSASQQSCPRVAFGSAPFDPSYEPCDDEGDGAQEGHQGGGPAKEVRKTAIGSCAHDLPAVGEQHHDQKQWRYRKALHDP